MIRITRSEPSASRPGPARRRVLLCALLWVVAPAAVACTGADPGYEGRSSRDWIAALQDPDTLARRKAASALGRVLSINPKASGVVDALVRTLADSNDEVRIEAATSLTQNGVLASEAVPGVVGALHDSLHVHTREHAALLLGTPPGAGPQERRAP